MQGKQGDPVQEFSKEIEKEGRGATTEGESAFLVIRAIESNAHEAGICLGYYVVAKGILQVSLPKVGTLVLANEINDNVKVFILDVDKG